MSCGMLAMMESKVSVDRYVAYEIDKYAIQTSLHNFPMIEQMGDVFAADFTQYEGFDFLIGGSPCTYWSIAQTQNRETTASGMGWELFSQYVRALREAKPKFFIYENNKSMSRAIRDSIRETFGFEEVLINSALVSAQNRQRYYWVGKRNEDGTYSKVNVQQPEDRGILLKDVLDGATSWKDKQNTIDANYFKGGNLTSPERQSGMRFGAAEPVCTTVDGKAYAVTSHLGGRSVANFMSGSHFPQTGVAEPVRVGTYPGSKRPECDSKQYRIYSEDGKAVTQCGQGGGLGAKTGLYAVPVNACGDKSHTLKAQYYKNGIANFVTNGGYDATAVAEPVQQYAVPCEWDENGIPIKAISGADGKTYTVYAVKDGQITIKGKTYPIKLIDGYYIIRKLTVAECKRLQTVPDWFEFPVSTTQAYRQLGNGWTVSVISHLINGIMSEWLREVLM